MAKKKVVPSAENKMEQGATENKSVALNSKSKAEVKEYKVIKPYDGIKVGTIYRGHFNTASYMVSNGYWQEVSNVNK